MKDIHDVKRTRFLFTLLPCYLLLVTLIGCEALARKFTRKPKQEMEPQNEMVVAPEEYKTPATNAEELYRQYFLFWKSWQDELIESLSSGTNQKKHLSCASEAIKNLAEARSLLKPEKQGGIDTYLLRLKQLRDAISEDVYGQSSSAHRYEAESIKRDIIRYFSYAHVKEYLQ